MSLRVHATQPKAIHAISTGIRERELLFQIETRHIDVYCGDASIVIDAFQDRKGNVTLGIRKFDSDKGAYRFIRKIPVKLSPSEKEAIAKGRT